MLEKPQMFFWSPQGFVYQRHYSLHSGFYRKRRISRRRSKTNLHETTLRDVNLDKNTNLKVYKRKFEKEIENVGTQVRGSSQEESQTVRRKKNLTEQSE